MTKKIIIVREADMNQTALYADMKAVSPQRLGSVAKAVRTVCAERSDFEAQRERIIGGALTVGQSPDIKHVDALVDNEAFLRMVAALRIDPRSFIFPQSQKDGKSETETSNLKSYRKARQIAEVIFYDNANDLENVAKVFAVCAYRFATSGHDLLTREYCANFLTSREFTSLDTGTAELWNAIDDIRAKQMSDGGASTQSGQMVRQLVALKSATDERDGRKKNVRVAPNGLVMQALMMRLGQLSA